MFAKEFLVPTRGPNFITLRLSKTFDSDEESHVMTYVNYSGVVYDLEIGFGYEDKMLQLPYKDDNMLWEVIQGDTVNLHTPNHVYSSELDPDVWDISRLQSGDVISLDVRT